MNANKAIAAGLAGSMMTIIAFICQRAFKLDISDIMSASQTVLTTLLVYYIPHSDQGASK